MVKHGKEIFSVRIKIIFILVFISTFGIKFSIAQKPFALVELFTSEGCSSCPPAEKVLSDIKTDAEKNHKNIFCLEYHVDYWNRLGWKDPFSSFQYTNRQKNYCSVLNEESIYTPMMIVNGTESFTGSNSEKAKSAIASALKDEPSIELIARIDSIMNDTAFVYCQSSKTDKNFFLRLVITQNKLVSKIGKGENSGKTLNHEGVLRVFFSSEMRNNSSQVKIPLKKFLPNKNCELIGFIQHKQTMKILAATAINF